jgi:hypothetical protein
MSKVAESAGYGGRIYSIINDVSAGPIVPYATKTFVIRGKGKLPSGPSGMGAKFIHGEMTIVPTHEAVHCSDLGFNSIKGLYIEQNSLGSFVIVTLVGPGSYDNYASLKTYNTGAGGTFVLNTVGTMKTNFMALGE